MHIRKIIARLAAAMIAIVLCARSATAQPILSQPALTLEELERLTLANNPTLAQAEAAIRAAEGRRKQAGLWPNPIVGYEADGLAVNELVHPYRSGHYVFVEQEIAGFGKLAKSKRIAAQEKVQTEAEAEARRLRVMNAVRMLYYETLGAQQMVDLRQQLADLTREAVKISAELFNVGQADRPDLLAAEVELQRAELDLMQAENNLTRVWQVMTAVVNEAQLKAMPKPARLPGSLEAEAPKLNREELLSRLLSESPEIKAAMAGIERAKAVVSRAKAEPRPDVFVRASVGYSNDWAEFFGGKTGWETKVEAGVRVPLFNRNQGNVAASSAELAVAEKELQRVELELRARLAETFNRYLNSLGVTARYHREILPRAEQAHKMYLAKFRQMAAAYPQVLIAQRTLFQARAEHVAALVELWQNVAQLRGMLLTGGLGAPMQMNGGATTGSSNGAEPRR